MLDKLFLSTGAVIGRVIIGIALALLFVATAAECRVPIATDTTGVYMTVTVIHRYAVPVTYDSVTVIWESDQHYTLTTKKRSAPHVTIGRTDLQVFQFSRDIGKK